MTHPLMESTFNAAVSNGVTLVEFRAPWCDACRSIAPLVEQLSLDYERRASCCTVNVDEQPGLAERFSVSAVPTVLVFRDGLPISTLIGAREYGEYTAALDQALGK